MERRAAIPAVALLGLSFTSCQEPEETIVGDWRAVELDGMELPKTYSEGDGTVVYGLQMTVEDDLAGDMVFYYEYDYDALTQRVEYGGDLTVDDADAPKYRITVTDFLGITSEPYYDTAGPYYAGDGEAPRVERPRPIAAPLRPELAAPTFTLACTLTDDRLTCEREDAEPDDFKKLVFTRHKPDGS